MMTSDEVGLVGNLPNLTWVEVSRCEFVNWILLFRGYTIEYRVIELEAEVVAYLERGEGLRIPEFLVRSRFSGEVEEGSVSSISEDEEVGSTRGGELKELISAVKVDGQSEDSETDSEQEEEEDFEFLRALDDQVRASISDLGGAVFPKLNWSAPKDAVWIAPTKTLKCHDLGEILLLLKSSDDIAHDMHRAYQGCQDRDSAPSPKLTLVLKQWCQIDPAREFRCFVLHNRLVGVSQRDTNPYPFLSEDLEWLKPKVASFINQVVIPKFPSTHYTIDIYVTTGQVVKIVDFNPASNTTHPLLFTWSELLQLNTNLPEWRIIRDTNHGHQAQSQRLTSNRIPIDFIHPDPETRAIIQKIASLT